MCMYVDNIDPRTNMGFLEVLEQLYMHMAANVVVQLGQTNSAATHAYLSTTDT